MDAPAPPATATVLRTTSEPTASLTLHPDRARRGNLAVLRESLRAHGQYRPIVANITDRRVLAGNSLLQAALEESETEVLVSWVDVNEATATRIMLVDNRATDVADYDLQALADLLTGLPDLEGTGYELPDVDELLASLADRAALNDPDDAPPAPDADEAVTRPGDLWILGEHRLLCGDATDEDAVRTLLGDVEQVDAVWTDPPYGVHYHGGTGLTIRNDALAPSALGELLRGAFSVVSAVLKPGGVFYVCSPSGANETIFRRGLDDAGLRLRQQLVWVKDRFVLGRQDYHQRHETILHGWADGGTPPPPPMYDDAHQTVLYGWADGAGHEWHGGRRQDTVWEFDRPAASALHPTMKPVGLVRRGVENSTRPGAVVLDLFAGAGSLLIACHGSSRRSLSLELDPVYVDVVCRRWQEHTGILPVLERTGQTVDFTLSDG